jgi:hypothetical protein
MLRIDVDHEEAGRPYLYSGGQSVSRAGRRAAGNLGVRLSQSLALLLRSSQRRSWLADVGQDRVEEVDIVHRGENYGWNVYEGFEPFSNQYRKEGRVSPSRSSPTAENTATRSPADTSIAATRTHRSTASIICGDYNSKRIFG